MSQTLPGHFDPLVYTCFPGGSAIPPTWLTQLSTSPPPDGAMTAEHRPSVMDLKTEELLFSPTFPLAPGSLTLPGCLSDVAVAPWMRSLVDVPGWFDACRTHAGASVHFFCVDCRVAACNGWGHAHHRVLQIRRSSYPGDEDGMVNVAGIQVMGRWWW